MRALALMLCFLGGAWLEAANYFYRHGSLRAADRCYGLYQKVTSPPSFPKHFEAVLESLGKASQRKSFKSQPGRHSAIQAIHHPSFRGKINREIFLDSEGNFRLRIVQHPTAEQKSNGWEESSAEFSTEWLSLEKEEGELFSRNLNTVLKELSQEKNVSSTDPRFKIIDESIDGVSDLALSHFLQEQWKRGLEEQKNLLQNIPGVGLQKLHLNEVFLEGSQRGSVDFLKDFAARMGFESHPQSQQYSLNYDLSINRESTLAKKIRAEAPDFFGDSKNLDLQILVVDSTAIENLARPLGSRFEGLRMPQMDYFILNKGQKRPRYLHGSLPMGEPSATPYTFSKFLENGDAQFMEELASVLRGESPSLENLEETNSLSLEFVYQRGYRSINERITIIPAD